MKKIICILLALTTMLCAIGCGGDSAQDDIKKPSVNNENDDGDDDAKDNADSDTQKPSAAVSISETVLLDEAGVKITAKSIDTDTLWGTDINFLIENNTEKDLIVQVRNTSVNGFMVYPVMSADVAAGKKVNDSLTLISNDLENSGISDIAQIETYFHICEADTYAGYFDSDKVVLETSIADTFDYSYELEGTTVYEGNGVTVKAKGLSEGILGTELILCIHNASDKAVSVGTRNVSVNGFMMDPLFSIIVMPGKYAIDGVTFEDSELEENEIKEIKEIELALNIFDDENWHTIVDTDPVTLNFE